MAKNDRVSALFRLLDGGFHSFEAPRPSTVAPACARCGDRRVIEVDSFRPTSAHTDERVIVVGSCPDCVTTSQPTEVFPYRNDFDLDEARRQKAQI